MWFHRCAADAPQLQIIGNGDIFSYIDWEAQMQGSAISTCMIGRGALSKPWIFTEIKERRHWDISATERLDMLKQFCSYGLEHWGSDTKGVETTRSAKLGISTFRCLCIFTFLMQEFSKFIRC